MSEGTTKNAQMQKKRAKLHFISEFFPKKVLFIKIVVPFPSLMPYLKTPTDDRETTERTPTQLPAYKK